MDVMVTWLFWPPCTAGKAAGTAPWRSCLGHSSWVRGLLHVLEEPGTGEATCSTETCQVNTLDPGSKTPSSCNNSPISPSPFTDKAFCQVAKKLKKSRSTFVEQAIKHECGVERDNTLINHFYYLNHMRTFYIML